MSLEAHGPAYSQMFRRAIPDGPLANAYYLIHRGMELCNNSFSKKKKTLKQRVLYFYMYG
jgi:hypothetical protein